MKIKFSSDDEFLLNKTIEIPSMIIIVRGAFNENNQYYSQVFLDECLYKLQARNQKQLQQSLMKKCNL